MRISGRHEKLAGKTYFIPNPLPPSNPNFQINSEMAILYGDTMYHLSKINEMAKKLPNIQAFIKAYIIKEALLTSEIEGIHTTILDVYTQPFLPSKPSKDTQLVMNYTNAVAEALYLIKEKNLPISSRVIKKAHEVLMSNGEGDKSDPGQYRDLPVRVGNLIPVPTKSQIDELMKELEEYINNDGSLPSLIKAGLAHVQFETIHPFFDGNGRIGRLLISLILIETKLLSDPIIYPSYYFKKHQFKYYEKLDLVRVSGDFESWIIFYLNVIKDSCIDAYKRAKEIEELNTRLTKKLSEKFNLRAINIRVQALSFLFAYPAITIKELETLLNTTYNTSKKIIHDFVRLKILVNDNKQNRKYIFKFKQYLEILEK